MGLISTVVMLTRPAIVFTCTMVVFIGWLSLSLLGTFFVLDNKLQELVVSEFTVSVVVASAQDGFNIFSAWEETVFLEVGDEVWHGNNTVSSGNGFEGAHFNKVLAGSKLPLGIVSGAMKSHLLVQKA